MKSDLPKVVHPIGGRAMVCAVVDACRDAGIKRIVAVVGYQQERVREALKGYSDIEYAVQAEQLGTGHAVQCAAANFTKESSSEPRASASGSSRSHDVMVLCGDGPLIRAETIRKVLERHRRTNASATLATAVIDDPQGYGRIWRGPDGKFKAIVEQKNCTPEQLKIKEVNPSYYCFDVKELFAALKGVTRNALTGEYYLTDTLEMLLKAGKRVEVIEAVPPEDVLSINTLEDLAKVDAIFRSRPGSSSRSGAGSKSSTTKVNA